MAIGSVASNRWLNQYGRTLNDDDRQVLGQARRLRDQERRAQVAAGHNPLSGGYAWQEFEDFHKVRKNEEALKGNRYGVGAFEGGGDINTRPVSGHGATRQVNATGGGGMAAFNAVGGPDFDAFGRRTSSGYARQAASQQMRQQREAHDLATERERLSLKALDDDLFYKNLARQMGATDAIMAGHGAKVRPEDRAWHDAALDEDLTDFAADREADRYWDPRQSSMRQSMQRDAVERATAPARVQGEYSLNRENLIADWRRDVADTQRSTRGKTAQELANQFLQSIARLSAEGAFGMTRGAPNAPPPQIQEAVNNLLLQYLQPGGAGGGSASAEDEEEIQMAMRQFNVDRATAERQLRAYGLIR